MTKTYVSGPMSGMPDFNRAAFESAREYLEEASFGTEFVDPVSEDIRIYGSWEAAIARPWQEHLARDVALVPTCDAIVMLDGWERSSGANLELRIARAFKLGVTRLSVLHTEAGPRYLWAAFPDADVDDALRDVGQVSPPPLEATERSRATTGASMVDPDDVGTSRAFYEGERFVPYSEAPERHVYETGGVKDNRGKAPIDLLPSRPLVATAEILQFGALKYKPQNWRNGLPWPDTYSSLQRHLLAWNDGEDLDPETGKSHLAHSLCQNLFLLDYVLTGVGAETDTRWRGHDHDPNSGPGSDQCGECGGWPIDEGTLVTHQSPVRCLRAGCPKCKNPAA